MGVVHTDLTFHSQPIDFLVDDVVERKSATQHVVHDDSQTEVIHGLIEFLELENFRGNEVGRPNVLLTGS